MKIVLFDTVENRYRIEKRTDVATLELTEEPFRGDEPVDVGCDIHRDGELAVVSCEARVRVNLPCARCLEPTGKDVVGSFTVVVRRLREGELPPDQSEEEIDIGGEEDVRYIPRDQYTLDIADLVRDVLLLAVPLKLLCDEECRGLCPTCGVNLNTSRCDCRANPADSRWQRLSGLFDDGKEHS